MPGSGPHKAVWSLSSNSDSEIALQVIPNTNHVDGNGNLTMDNNRQPHKLSWIDRFTGWVERLPVQAWVFYILFGIALILVQILFLWLDGGLFAGELLPVIIFNGLATPFLLAQIHLLDNQAAAAVVSLKPMLEISESEFEDYKFRLTNMPFLKPLIAGLVIMVSTMLTPLVSTAPVRYAALELLPVFNIVFQIVDKSSAFLFGVVIYHTIRQLRLVNSINSKHIRINLFQLRPLHAFSRLTASTALALLAFLYVWMLINPEILADPVLLAYSILLTIMAAAIFVWPLWGIHTLIEKHKEAALDEINLRSMDLFTKLNQSIDGNDYDATDRLNSSIASLEIQHKRISDVPTWPWRSETARLAISAIALPLLLMIIQYFALQALDR